MSKYFIVNADGEEECHAICMSIAGYPTYEAASKALLERAVKGTATTTNVAEVGKSFIVKVVGKLGEVKRPQYQIELVSD